MAAGTLFSRPPLLLTDVDIAQDLVHLLLRNLRSLLGVGIERIADDASSPWRLACSRIRRICPTRRRRPCSIGRRGNRWRESAGDGFVHVSVGENDVGAFPTQLETQTLERICRRLLNDLGRIDVAGEGNLVDLRMSRREPRVGRFPKAVHDVQHARRQARFGGQLQPCAEQSAASVLQAS